MNRDKFGEVYAATGSPGQALDAAFAASADPGGPGPQNSVFKGVSQNFGNDTYN